MVVRRQELHHLPRPEAELLALQQGPSGLETPRPAPRAIALGIGDALRPGLFHHHVGPNRLVLLDGQEAAIRRWGVQQREVSEGLFFFESKTLV